MAKTLTLWCSADKAPQNGTVIIADFQTAKQAKKVVWNKLIRKWVETKQTSHPESYQQHNMIRWKNLRG